MHPKVFFTKNALPTTTLLISNLRDRFRVGRLAFPEAKLAHKNNIFSICKSYLQHSKSLLHKPRTLVPVGPQFC